MRLMIVESPGKIKTISKYVPRDVLVKASVGHCYGIERKLDAIDVENNFKPKYVVLDGKTKVVQELKKLSKDAETVFIATDGDREGAAIGWHLAKRCIDKSVPIQRVIFYEITQKAIQNAMDNPTDLNEDLYNAQQARSVLDMLVGFKVSRALWSGVASGTSAGRVQSIGLKIIVERQKEIDAFKPEEYWSIEAKFKKDNKEILTSYKIVDKIKNKQDTDQILDQIKKIKVWNVKSVEQAQKTRKPSALFITSSLQQFCSANFDWDGKRTMAVAQKLYEEGLITYHRTDSVNISESALKETRELILKIGKEYLPAKPIVYKSRDTAQEAHEGIRPAHLEHTLEEVRLMVKEEQFKLYEAIFKKFVSCQMTDAKFSATKLTIESSDKIHNFTANGNMLVFDGFLIVWTYTDSKELQLPLLNEGENLELVEVKSSQHFTKPPASFNDSSLVKFLEERGIGRPSTYANIVDTIIKRGYVDRKNKAFIPTEIGKKVSNFLMQYFPELMNEDYTARIERELDEVASAKKVWHKIVGDFYVELEKRLSVVKVEKPASTAEETKIICPNCQKHYLIKRKGPYGEFFGCSGFKLKPNNKDYCKATFQVGENGEPVRREQKTPAETFDKRKCDCGADLVIRTARKSGDKFVGCTKYPFCKKLYTIEGVLIVRKSEE